MERRRKANELQRRVAAQAEAAHYQREYNNLFTRVHALHPEAAAAEVRLATAQLFERTHPRRYLPKDVG